MATGEWVGRPFNRVQHTDLHVLSLQSAWSTGKGIRRLGKRAGTALCSSRTLDGSGWTPAWSRTCETCAKSSVPLPLGHKITVFPQITSALSKVQSFRDHKSFCPPPSQSPPQNIWTLLALIQDFNPGVVQSYRNSIFLLLYFSPPLPGPKRWTSIGQRKPPASSP